MAANFQKRCQIGGCDNATSKCCATCGFWPEESKRRREIAPVMCKDGLRRKIIRRKKNDVEDG